MKKLVYDLPSRAFHWIFAGLFIVAFGIAKTIDDDSPVFAYHMMAGLMLGFVVLLRIIWGVVGTKYARFSSFALNPKELISYFFGIVSGSKKLWTGHNPASSWAGLTMMGLALGLGVTGYLMANGQKEQFEDIHEILANGFLVVVILHVAGIILHTVRHKDGIGLAMVSGRKSNISEGDQIPGFAPKVALLFLVLIGSFSVYLFNQYNTQTQTLNLFGKTLQLGEAEEGQGPQESGEDDDD